MFVGISQYEAHFVSCEAAIVEIPPVSKIRPANQYIDHIVIQVGIILGAYCPSVTRQKR
jgi:hypothetical protein